LKAILVAAHAAESRGDWADRAPLIGLAGWVADWIPDLDDPLLALLTDVEDLL
jgi:hypothetical protein